MTQPPFWHPALPRVEIWRTLVGFAIIIAAWMLGSLAIVAGGAALLGRPIAIVAQARDLPSAMLFFGSFAGFHVGLALVLWSLHKRLYRSVFGPSLRLNWRHFGIGLAVVVALSLVLNGVTEIEGLLFPEDVAPQLQLARPVSAWIVGVIPALALIFVQILAEEAVFRGYLLQQLRARFTSPLVWAVLPAFVFGMLHYQPGAYGTLNALAYVLNATVMGAMAAFVTVRTGNLGAAAGLHFGNNATLVMIGMAGAMDGFSLFTVEVDLRSGYMTYSIIMQTLVFVLAFMAWWRWMNRHRPIANDTAAP